MSWSQCLENSSFLLACGPPRSRSTSIPLLYQKMENKEHCPCVLSASIVRMSIRSRSELLHGWSDMLSACYELICQSTSSREVLSFLCMTPVRVLKFTSRNQTPVHIKQHHSPGMTASVAEFTLRERGSEKEVFTP